MSVSASGYWRPRHPAARWSDEGDVLRVRQAENPTELEVLHRILCELVYSFVIRVVKGHSLQNTCIWAWMLQILYFCSLCVKLGILCEETWRVTRERTGNQCRDTLPEITYSACVSWELITSIYVVFDLNLGHSLVELSHHCLIPTTTWCRRRVLTRSAELRSPGWTNTAHWWLSDPVGQLFLFLD